MPPACPCLKTSFVYEEGVLLDAGLGAGCFVCALSSVPQEESAGNSAPSYLIASAGLLDPLKQNVGTGESGRGI